MVAHPLPVLLVNRQVGVSAPTGAGITNSAIVVDPGAATTATSLAFDSAATSASISPPPFAGTSDPVITTSSTQSSSAATPSVSVEAASGASSSIALSTVIGTCVGAFIGACAFIFLAIWFYRRYSRSLKQRSYKSRAARSPLSHDRNARGEEQRRRSRLEMWNKLEEGDDKWDGMYKPKEMDIISPMEKLTMFQKSPSVRTNFTRKSDEVLPPFEPQSFAQFLPNLANDSASQEKVPLQMPEPRELLDHEPQNLLGGIDSGPSLSWGSDPVGAQPAYLSATRLSGGAMSPTLNMAIPTPPATSSEPHRWESAEVVNFSEGQYAEVVNSGQGQTGSRQSRHNPFFNAQPSAMHRRSGSRSSSRSRTTRSRSNSTVTVHNTPNKGKEKERIVSIDPFSDPLPKPSFIQHLPTSSASSSASNDRAIKLLVAALDDDVSEAEIQRRLRAASMQPSIMSNGSMYTDADPDDVARDFPFPPSSTGHS